MKTEISPFPWIVSDWSSDGDVEIHVSDKEGRSVCSVDCHFLSEEKMVVANAHLIAAAPDILNSLKGSHHFFTILYDRLVNAGEEEEVLEEFSKTLAAMTESISKAKGQ